MQLSTFRNLPCQLCPSPHHMFLLHVVASATPFPITIQKHLWFVIPFHSTMHSSTLLRLFCFVFWCNVIQHLPQLFFFFSFLNARIVCVPPYASSCTDAWHFSIVLRNKMAQAYPQRGVCRQALTVWRSSQSEDVKRSIAQWQRWKTLSRLSARRAHFLLRLPERIESTVVHLLQVGA